MTCASGLSGEHFALRRGSARFGDRDHSANDPGEAAGAAVMGRSSKEKWRWSLIEHPPRRHESELLWHSYLRIHRPVIRPTLWSDSGHAVLPTSARIPPIHGSGLLVVLAIDMRQSHTKDGALSRVTFE
jgi:hypothetical protein